MDLQNRIKHWVGRTLGPLIFENKWERTMRVLEEACELAQAEGITREELNLLVDRVYSRPIGESLQEASGVGVCLLAWAGSRDRNLMELIEKEVSRIEQMDPVIIQEKQKAKAMAGVALYPQSP
jgi:hypothetical protein